MEEKVEKIVTYITSYKRGKIENFNLSGHFYFQNILIENLTQVSFFLTLTEILD